MPEWYLGQNLTSSKRGIFPKSFVSLRPPDRDPASSSAADVGEEAADEILRTLHGWRVHWKRLYVHRDTAKFVKVKELMDDLSAMRRQLTLGMLTQEQTRSLRVKIGEKVDLGNQLLELELVPREESGGVPKSEKVGPVHLWDLVSEFKLNNVLTRNVSALQ